MPSLDASPRSGATRRLSGLLASLLIAAALLAQFAASSEAAPRPLTTGISYIHVDDSAPVVFENVKRAGARLVLTPLEWGEIVPEQRPANFQPDDPADPSYDWDAYDAWVRGAVAAGMTPVLQIRGAPRWAQRCTFVHVDAPCDPDPADLAAFATAAARRYSGNFNGLPHVQYWQGLNEPNLSIFFEPQFVNGQTASPSLYRKLLNSFYFAIKGVNPANLVMAAGLAPLAVPNFTIGPMRFTRELLCMKGRKKPKPLPGDCEGGVYFDIFDIHPYTTGSPSHEGGVDDVQLGDLDKLVGLLKAADKAGRIKNTVKGPTPLWITELAWDSQPPDPGGLPLRILTRWTAEALHVAWSAGVSNFFWYSLRDTERRPGEAYFQSLESGLYFRGANIAADSPKPNLYAFRFPFVAYPGRKGLEFWGRTPNSAGGKVVLQSRKGKKWRTVAVTRANSVGIFNGRAKTHYGANRKGAIRALYRGEASPAFSMRPVPDFFQPPFGKPTG